MITPLLAAALALQPATVAPSATPPTDQAAVLSQENRALLRCAAAFALVSHGQANGDAAARQWPDLGARGREFFVRALAQLMDATGSDRTAIAERAAAEARALSASGEVATIMPSCLVMLESSGV